MVEDEAGTQALLEDILRRPGYQVLTATTVPEAEAARQRLGPGSLNLVIANIHLTGGPEAREGDPVSQRWRAWHPGLPFALSSGHPPPEISQPFASG
jgi:DNA-binding response OmpR family regulator